MPGFQELVVLFVIGLLILGPERLPRVASQIGRWVGKARRTANQLRHQLEREVVLADLEERNKGKKQKEAKSSGLAQTPDRPTASRARNTEEAPATADTTHAPGGTGSPGTGGAAAPDGGDSG